MGTSANVIRVYFLDGSYKAVCFDKSITAADLAATLLPHSSSSSSSSSSPPIALFQVERDFSHVDQVRLPSTHPPPPPTHLPTHSLIRKLEKQTTHTPTHPQFTYLPPTELISDVVSRWVLGGERLRLAKLLLPLYSSPPTHPPTPLLPPPTEEEAAASPLRGGGWVGGGGGGGGGGMLTPKRRLSAGGKGGGDRGGGGGGGENRRLSFTPSEVGR